MIIPLYTAARTRLAPLAVRHAQINWTLTDQAVVSSANFITSLIVARFLGLEAFGIFSLALLILYFVQSFQVALILTPMLSVGPKQTGEEAASYYGALLTWQQGFALFSATIAAAVAAFAGAAIGIGEAGVGLALPLAFAVIAAQMHEFLRRFCFARGRSSGALRLDVVRYGVQAVALLLLFLAGKGSIKEAVLVVAASAVLGCAALFPDFPPFRLELRHILAAARRHWQMSKWLVPSALAQWAGLNIFTLAAGAVLGPAAVGALRVAQSLLGVMGAFFQAMDNVLLPKAALAYKGGGHKGLHAFVRKMFLLYVTVSGFVALAFAVPAKFWLDLLYGAEYASYGLVVVGFAVTQFLTSAAMPFSVAMKALERTFPILFCHMVVSGLAAVAAWPLATHFGLLGVVCGTIASQGLILVVLWLWYERFSLGVPTS